MSKKDGKLPEGPPRELDHASVPKMSPAEARTVKIKQFADQLFHQLKECRAGEVARVMLRGGVIQIQLVGENLGDFPETGLSGQSLIEMLDNHGGAAWQGIADVCEIARVERQAPSDPWRDVWFDEDDDCASSTAATHDPAVKLFNVQFQRRLCQDIDRELPPDHYLVSGREPKNELIMRNDGSTCAWSDVGGRDRTEDGFWVSPNGLASADGAGISNGADMAHIALKMLALNNDPNIPLRRLFDGIEQVMRERHPRAMAGTALAMGRRLSIDESGEEWELAWVSDAIPMVINPRTGERLFEGIPFTRVGEILRDAQSVKGALLRELKVDYTNRLSGALPHQLTPEMEAQILRFLHPDNSPTSMLSPNFDHSYVNGMEDKILKIPKGFVLFLAVDGILDVISHYEVGIAFRQHSFERACKALKKMALNRQEALRKYTTGQSESPHMAQIGPNVWVELGRIFGDDHQGNQDNNEGDNVTFTAHLIGGAGQ